MKEPQDLDGLVRDAVDQAKRILEKLSYRWVLQLREDSASLAHLVERFRRCQEPIEDGTRHFGSFPGDELDGFVEIIASTVGPDYPTASSCHF